MTFSTMMMVLGHVMDVCACIYLASCVQYVTCLHRVQYRTFSIYRSKLCMFIACKAYMQFPQQCFKHQINLSNINAGASLRNFRAFGWFTTEILHLASIQQFIHLVLFSCEWTLTPHLAYHSPQIQILGLHLLFNTYLFRLYNVLSSYLSLNKDLHSW